MHKSYLFILFLLILSTSIQALPFTPMVKNYKISDYKGGMQNWSIGEDSQGRIYVGNNKGLLTYDGGNWICYTLPNHEVVRSIFVTDSCVYVGSYQEFGYFKRDHTNRMVYHSLSDELSNYTFHQDEIWGIIDYNNTILFQSFASYFIYDNHTITPHQDSIRPLYFFDVDSSIYVQEMNGNFFQYKDGNYIKLLDNSLLNHAKIVSTLNNPQGGLILVTDKEGIFKLENKKLSRLTINQDIYHFAYDANRAVLTQDSLIIVGTLSNGIYAIALDGSIKWHLNTESVLQNNTVLGLYCDAQNNIWAALDNGISYIEHNSPISVFVPNTRNFGMVYDYYPNVDKHYFTTNQGVYFYDENTHHFSLIDGLSEQSWFVHSFSNQILCGHNRGTFLLSPLRQISDISGARAIQRYTTDHSEYLIVGTYSDLVLLDKDANGVWEEANYINNVDLVVKELEIDYRGRIWIEDVHRGIYRITLTPDFKQVAKKESIILKDKNSDDAVHLLKYNGDIVLSSSIGFLGLDLRDSLVSYEKLNALKLEDTYPHGLVSVNRDYFWLVYDDFFRLIHQSNDSLMEEGRISTNFYESSVEGVATVHHNQKDGYSYMVLNGMIARINPLSLAKQHVIYPIQISSIWTEKGPSLDPELNYYPIENNIKIPYGSNLIGFTFSNTNYNLNDSYTTRVKLEGYDSSWREVHNNQIRYHQLKPGTYTLKVELLEQEVPFSQEEFSFRVMPPWYLSWVAIVCYVVLSCLLLLFIIWIVYFIMNRKKQEQIKLQEEKYQMELSYRTHRITSLEKQQLEEQLSLKSKELSEVTFLNISHQEFLQNLRDEVVNQRKNGTEHRKFLDRIMNMIQSNILSEEDNWQLFQNNFDNIHQNFFRHLKEKYPSLTSGDLKLCALLRLNFSTKDIAHMLNITIRGVDTARYRLRKKLDLPSDESLVDFMLKFK